MKTRIMKAKYCLSLSVVLIVLLLSFKGCHSSEEVMLKGSYSTISVSEANELIENNTNLFILDVRTESEYKEGHIQSACLIPHSDIIDRQEELPTNKSQAILVYCRSGTRSATASSTLESLNFTQIYNMEGGFTAWKNAGYPYINSSTTGSSLLLVLNIFILMIICLKRQFKHHM